MPNDALFDFQWHHSSLTDTNASIRTPEAWDVTTGATNIVLAILDTGLDASLSDFSNRVVDGYNFVSSTTNWSDDHGHGTQVSTVAAATGNNGTGGAGVDWNCRIMPVKVLNQDNLGNYSDIAAGVEWAVSNNADVINLSMGAVAPNFTLATAISNAVNQGVTVVTISHNFNSPVFFPGTMSNVITVGATATDSKRASFSNFGPEVDIVAPGTNIICQTTNGLTRTAWGTSLSAPQVAGAATLLLSLNPSLTPAQLHTLLTAGADDQIGDPSEDTPGFDDYHGWGRLNVMNSLILAQTQLTMERSSPASPWTLHWSSPPNATNRMPYSIEYTDNLTNSWQTLTNLSSIAYGVTNSSWTDNGSETGSHPTNTASRYYRVRIDTR